MKLSDFHPGFEGWTPVENPVSKSPQLPNDQTQVNGYLRATLPLPLQYSSDTLRQYNRPGLSSFRIAPLPPGGVPSINSTASGVTKIINQSSTGKSVVLETDGIANADQNVLNIIGGAGITAVSDASGGVTLSGGGGTDGLVHGDSVWPHDSAYVELRDDFINAAQNPASATAQIGSLGWALTQGTSGFTSNGFQEGLGSLHIGEMSWGNSSTSNSTPTSGIGTLFINTIGPSGSGPETVSWPLLDTAGWKLTFVWRFHRLTDPIIGIGAGTPFDVTQKSMYVGLGTNVAIPGNQGWSRPPIFIGARYDTDPTAPSIGDTTIHLEAVVNPLPTSTTPTRNNTQGTVFNTGVTPTEDVYYRLDIVCEVVGTVTMSLNGSTPQTFVIPKYTADNSGIAVNSDAVGTANSMAILQFGTIGGVRKNHPFSTGSQVVVSGFTLGNTPLNGSWTLTQSANNLNATQPTTVAYLEGTVVTGGTPGGWQIVGYPALIPIVMWGNDTQAAPVSRTRICIDFFSFVSNAGIANASAVPDPTKSRYF